MLRRLPNIFVALTVAGMVLFVLSYLALNPTSVRKSLPPVPKRTNTNLKLAKFMHLPHTGTVSKRRNISSASHAVTNHDALNVDFSSSSRSLAGTHNSLSLTGEWLNPAQNDNGDNTTLSLTRNQSIGIYSINNLPGDKPREYPMIKDHETLHGFKSFRPTNKFGTNITSNGRSKTALGVGTQSQHSHYKMKSDKQTNNSTATIQIKSSPKALDGDQVTEAKHQLKNTTSRTSKCNPVKNIVFWKTHKCATTTVQNIMFRYGDEHQLRFVLPKSKTDHRFSMRMPFNRRQVMTRGRGIPGKGMKNKDTFNIFTNHAIFNPDEIEALMPSDSIYVTILRDPVTMFESMYTYLRLDLRYSPDGGEKHLVSLEEFLDNAPKYYNNREKVYGSNFSRNPMMYDFGLPPEDMDDISKVDHLISVIDKRFDLVMLADYFEESLIMLKALLCLQYRDITYVTMNARSEESVHKLGGSLAKKIRRWNWADVRLFDHFNRTFHDKLERFGIERMTREKQQLERRNDWLKKQCVADVAVDMDNVWHPDGVKIEGYILKKKHQGNNDGICQKMTRSEIMYTNILKKRQSGLS